MPPLLFRNYRYSQTIITELSGSFHNIFITSFVVDVSVPLRGLYPYKGAPYQWLNHAGSKPGFRGTTLRRLNFCDNFFHNVRETACLLMRGGFSVVWLLYAYSIPREDGLIKAFIGIFSEKNQAIFTISEFVKNPTCIFSSPSYFFWQVERTRLQYTMSCKKHSVLWIL